MDLAARSVTVCRLTQVKPSIPMVSRDGIRSDDELEFELGLDDRYRVRWSRLWLALAEPLDRISNDRPRTPPVVYPHGDAERAPLRAVR